MNQEEADHEEHRWNDKQTGQPYLFRWVLNRGLDLLRDRLQHSALVVWRGQVSYIVFIEHTAVDVLLDVRLDK